MVPSTVLGSPQRQALGHVRSLVEAQPVDGETAEPHGRITMHFHPDRSVGGVPILESMARDGLYRCQFETGTSNGGLTAFAGGDRWVWESRIFGGAYDSASASERPKYGALNFRRRTIGGSPRFGSAHLRLAEKTLDRTTFCYPDSACDPRHFGLADRQQALIALARTDDKDPLDDYIEAHVHGPVQLDRDIEAIVLDPCYRGTDVEHMARNLGCPVGWHSGFRLDIAELQRHPEYRGREFVNLGLELAVDGYLDPRILGDAARTKNYDEQALKRVWHYIARFGATEY